MKKQIIYWTTAITGSNIITHYYYYNQGYKQAYNKRIKKKR